MADHDQRFKTLLQEFFGEFVRLFFPQWAGLFDFSRVEWLGGEVFPDPPQGARRCVDLVARVPTRRAVAGPRAGAEAGWVVLVHVEVEWEHAVAPLRPRMFDYYWMLRHRHDLPVLPIGLYLRVGLNGVGWDEFEEAFEGRRLIHFEYPYVGLPALNAEEYLHGDNWLGVALTALMNVPEEGRARLKAEALRRLVACPENEYRRHLLCECVQAYLPLEGPQLREFEQLLLTQEQYAGVRAMGLTWREEGAIEGKRQLLQRQLERRFGPLGAAARRRLESWPVERVDEVGLQLLDAQSLRELGLEEDQPA
jgi:hypothetical protein